MSIINEIIILIKETMGCSADKLLGHETRKPLDLMVLFMILLFSAMVVCLTPIIAIMVMTYTTWNIVHPIIEEGAKDEVSNKNTICPTGN